MMMQTRFHLAIRWLHWAMALLIMAMLFIGIGMVSTAGQTYTQLLTWHRPIGVAILVLACVRLAIRFATKSPPLPATLSPVQARIAKASHVLLYLAMIGLPLIGWGMISAGGYPVQIGGWTLPPLLPHDAFTFGFLRAAHTLIAFAFFALILVHLTAALFHRFVFRDGVMSAMSLSKRDDLTKEG
jgi:cytochrome b561